MSFEAQKKISVPCEKHLQKEKLKKRRSKLFVNKDNSSGNSSTDSNNDSNELIGDFSEVIRANLFERMMAEQSDSDDFTSGLDDKSGLSKKGKDGYNNPLLNRLLKELEDDSFEETKEPSRTQPLTCKDLLKTKGKRLDFSQKFANMPPDSHQLDTFQSKRSQI